MNITYRNIRRFQQGGPVAPEEMPAEEMPAEEAPVEEGAPEQGQDPMMQLAQIFAQGLQNQDCQALAQGAQMFLELLQQQAGPAPEEQGQPVFRKGGILAYRIIK